MSEILGFLLLALCVLAFVSKVASELCDIYRRRRFMAVERVAVEEYRRSRPVDTIAILQALGGADPPRYTRTLPADPDRASDTRRRIGSVRIAAAAPCDAVVRPAAPLDQAVR